MTTTVGVALCGHPPRSINERMATEGHPYSCCSRALRAESVILTTLRRKNERTKSARRHMEIDLR